MRDEFIFIFIVVFLCHHLLYHLEASIFFVQSLIVRKYLYHIWYQHFLRTGCGHIQMVVRVTPKAWASWRLSFFSGGGGYIYGENELYFGGIIDG